MIGAARLGSFKANSAASNVQLSVVIKKTSKNQ